MAHVQELARERQRSLLAGAVAQRDGQRARQHSRVARQAERAERRQASQAERAERLRVRLHEMESGS